MSPAANKPLINTSRTLLILAASLGLGLHLPTLSFAQDADAGPWGSKAPFKTVVPITLSLTRANKEIDRIAVPVGTVVTAEPNGEGAKAYWMGEEFALPWNAVAPIYAKGPEPQRPSGPVTITLDGENLENVEILKDYPKSLYISHSRGKTFIKKEELNNESLVALGLGVGEVLPQPEQDEKGLVIKTVHQFGATPARLVAFNLHNTERPIYTKRFKNMVWEGGQITRPISPENYEGWEPEEVIWFVQKAYQDAKAQRGLVEGSTLNALTKMHAEQQTPGYYGKNFEKIYQVSLRPEFKKAGIRAYEQAGPTCGWYATANFLQFLLWKSGKVVTVNPEKLKAIDIITNPEIYEWQGARKSAATLTWVGSVNSKGIPTSQGSLQKHVFKTPIQTTLPSETWGNPNLLAGKAKKTFFSPELIFHELRMGRPVSATILAAPSHDDVNHIKAVPNMIGHSVIIVGAYVVSPEPNLQVVYEILNSWGSDWGEKGYGWVDDDLLTSAHAYELQ
jgi:hypothetical protein